jgi:hypothetical protein
VEEWRTSKKFCTLDFCFVAAEQLVLDLIEVNDEVAGGDWA